MFDDHVDFVSVFHVQVLGGLVLVDALAIEQETHVGGSQLTSKTFTLWRWQYASISFLSWVVAFILKKISSPS